MAKQQLLDLPGLKTLVGEMLEYVHTENSNITKATIGLGNVDNTADIKKNVASANKLSTAKTISLTGGVTGSAATDWSNNVSITAVVGDNTHKHGSATITDIDAGKIKSGTISIERLPAHTHELATASASGFMPPGSFTKLNGIAAGAEVNQNTFSKIAVGSTTVEADTKTDTLTLAAGSNITLTPDAANDRITIAAADTGLTAVNANNGLSKSISGRTLTLGISSLSTDLLIQGTNSFILDCGTSAF